MVDLLSLHSFLSQDSLLNEHIRILRQQNLVSIYSMTFRSPYRASFVHRRVLTDLPPTWVSEGALDILWLP
jgi:hypothetical protein